MEQLLPLLNLLSDGEYYSGEDIGSRLNVTRAAVWKQIKRLEAMGLPMEACRGRGYRIAQGLSMLDRSAIERHISAGTRQYMQALHVFGEVKSTNEMALQRLRQGSASGHVYLAEGQTEGKGRRGKVWVSPIAANIYLSLVVRFELGAAAVEGLSLAIGVAVAQALDALGVSGLRLKWPNDILWNGRKLGGILLELVGDPMGACDVVVGIGLNVNMPDQCEARIDQAWVDLREIMGRRVDRNAVAGALLDQVLPMLADYQKDGFVRYRTSWEQLDGMRDERVVLTLGNQRIAGRARGVDKAGSIRIETPDGVRCYPAGDISLRAER